MSDAFRKRGRPLNNERRTKLSVVNFKADAETLRAIEKLVDETSARMPLGAGLPADKLRSAAIRRGLQLAAGMIEVPVALSKK